MRRVRSHLLLYYNAIGIECTPTATVAKKVASQSITTPRRGRLPDADVIALRGEESVPSNPADHSPFSHSSIIGGPSFVRSNDDFGRTRPSSLSYRSYYKTFDSRNHGGCGRNRMAPVQPWRVHVHYPLPVSPRPCLDSQCKIL